MRMSELFCPTLREVPSEAEVISHKLLVRAGMLRKAAAGIYTYLPLAQRTLKKISRIVREEMDKAGGQELLLPIMQPADIWQETGRWDVYGEEMFRVKDRHNRDFCLGPTHEEIITTLVKNDVRSYRQLPVMLYQIQDKFRDEIRPRFGLMRGREFIMKDMYSFDRDEEGLERSYRKAYKAYCRTFARCDLEFRVVEADSGAIGGEGSHEFMVLAESGEAEILYCTCGYAANSEKASARPAYKEIPAASAVREEVHTPGCRSIVEVAGFLGVPADQCLKTLFYYADNQLIAVIVRGTDEVNEVKLQNATGALQIFMARDEDVEKELGLPVGFLGPVGLKDIPIFVDKEAMSVGDAVTGANKKDYHLLHVNPRKDFSPKHVGDLRLARPQEGCIKCGKPLQSARGIEVGHIFKLGTKYSKSLGAVFLNEQSQEEVMIMGCYGIGITRTMAAAIEQNYDENGIIWPVPIAPFHVIVTPVNYQDDAQRKAAEDIYHKLIEEGIEAVYDDRDERPGVKFKDADLIGFPMRVVIGPKGLEQNMAEVKIRRKAQAEFWPLDELLPRIKDFLAQEMARIEKKAEESCK